MNLTLIRRTLVGIVVLIGILLFIANQAFAHCDTMDGPVVKAARAALQTQNVNLVLIWVSQRDEAEVKQAFRSTLRVRRLNREARQLADKYFFETVVRLHRTSEGEPYTGLKPAGTDLGPVIPVADDAFAGGPVEPLLKLFPENLRPEIQDRFRAAVANKNFDKDDVEAGRRYVAKYVSFLQYLEHLYERQSQKS